MDERSQFDDHQPGASAVIRSHSSVLKLYPSLFVGAGCAVWLDFGPNAADDAETIVGTLFLGAFFFNLSAVVFRFSRATFVATALVGAGTLLTALLSPGFSELLIGLLELPLRMNAAFCWTWSACLAGLMGLDLLYGLADFYVLRDDELVHYHGLAHHPRRWPLHGLTVRTDTGDAAAYWLLSAGRLTIRTSPDARPIQLDNVLGIDRTADRLRSAAESAVGPPPGRRVDRRTP